MIHNHQPRLYEITMSSGSKYYLLAANSEQAAWSAVELSKDVDTHLTNIRIADEW